MRQRLVDAYLEYAKSPMSAIKLVKDRLGDSRVKDGLCESLAKFGFLDDALEVARSEPKAEKRATLDWRIAYATAKAGRARDTQRAIENAAQHEVPNVAYRTSSVFLELVGSLRSSDRIDLAEEYATRITDSVNKRKLDRLLRRPLRKTAKTTGQEKDLDAKQLDQKRKQFVLQKIQVKDAVAAAELLESKIAEAKANPVKASTGQFGPSNQTTHLASIELEFANVAFLYHLDGNPVEATANMKRAEDAIEKLSNENAFFAWMKLMDFYQVQMAMNDVEGLKRSTDRFLGELWLVHAHQIVSKVLLLGDVDAARRIAQKALATKPAFATRDPGVSAKVISCFVEADETMIALELLKYTQPDNYGIAACQYAGTAMIQSKRGLLLRTSKWRNGLKPFQRANVFIGAAIAAKKVANADAL